MFPKSVTVGAIAFIALIMLVVSPAMAQVPEGPYPAGVGGPPIPGYDMVLVPLNLEKDSLSEFHCGNALYLGYNSTHQKRVRNFKVLYDDPPQYLWGGDTFNLTHSYEVGYLHWHMKGTSYLWYYKKK